MSVISVLIMPGGLLLLTGLVASLWMPLPESVAVLRVYPYVVLGAGLYFGCRFHRSQLLFAILLLAVADRGLLYYGPGGAAASDAGRTVFHAVALLLPLNLAGLSLIAERGIVTFRGLLRLIILLSQLVLVALLCQPEQAALAARLEHPFVNAPWTAGLSIGQPALLAFGTAWGVVIVRFIRRPNVIAGSFFWALVAVFLALAADGPGSASTAYFSTAGLVLVLSIIETSYALAYRDELTGLEGRRALSEALLKLGRQYTIAMIDVDHFKTFNDRHGHDAGDQLLRMVAAKLAHMPGGGKAFRYGGEEFVVLFPGRSIQDAIPHLEMLRKAVEATQFTLRGRNRPEQKPKRESRSGPAGQSIAVTVSIGVAEGSNRNVDPTEVITAADQAMYRAKKAGRNMLSI